MTSETPRSHETTQSVRPSPNPLALAHPLTLTLHAMIRNGSLYDPQPSTQLPTAA